MMKQLKTRIRFLLLRFFIVIPVTSLGADNNYRDFLVGGRAIGLGGAFTATANDVTSLLYNPAGLSFVESTSASAFPPVFTVLNAEVSRSFHRYSLMIMGISA